MGLRTPRVCSPRLILLARLLASLDRDPMSKIQARPLPTAKYPEIYILS
jgi:hypothetical protein